MKTPLNNIFEFLPVNLDKEVFETIVANDHIKIERIISKGHTAPESGWFNQTLTEWVLLVKGEAIITIRDDRDYRLTIGDYMSLPAGVEHRVKWTVPETETIWLAIQF